MPHVAAILTSTPSLLRCELDRLKEQVALDAPGSVAGLGAYEDKTVIQRRFGAGVPRPELWEAPDSEVALFTSAKLTVGQSLEDDGQPFRFREWLAAVSGPTDAHPRLRERIVEQLPEFLQRSVRGSTLGEVVFVAFVSELKASGRLEDPTLDATMLAKLLVATTARISATNAEVGGATRLSMGVVASNGQVLGGARHGARSLAYRLFEGESFCARHGLGKGVDEADPLVRDHRMRRSVGIASDPLPHSTGWVQIPDCGAVTVGRDLKIVTLG